MKPEEFQKQVRAILEQDDRYAAEAYEFVSDAFNFTAGQLFRNSPRRHISGQELLTGVGEFAKHQFGPLAGEVLAHWGLVDSVAIGHVVFNMAEHGLLSTSDDDSIEDFKCGFNFDDAFRRPFEPEQKHSIHPPIIA